MKKIVLSLATVLLFAMGSNAQKQVGGGLGMLRLSLGSGTDATNLLGLHAFGKYNVNDNVRIGANLGYYSKSEDGLSFFSMPISGLVEYTKNSGKLTPYGGIEVGLNSMGFRYKGESESEGFLFFAPVAGIEFELTKQLNGLVNAKYNYIMTEGEATTGIGFNVGVAYNL